MSDFGMIHEKLDIKILILFILRRLPGAVGRERLAELVLLDKGIGYFDYVQCLAELTETGHVQEEEEGYSVTEKGASGGAAVESSLPYTVRRAAERKISGLAGDMRRSSMIKTGHTGREDGCLSVSLKLSDGAGDIIEMRVLAPDEAAALRMEAGFRARAEDIYNTILNILMEENRA